MAAEKIHIERFLELAKQYPVFDVRSPGEFNHAHIPGAYSLPLFTDDERAAVGTAYKQESREKAIKIGLDFYGPKMKAMVEKAEEISGSKFSPESGPRCLLIYCWRGGMRSGAVSWLLDLYGFKIYTLTGGYKKFRNYVLNSFKNKYAFNILGGYTGSGKTETLKELKQKGEPIVDLEDIAKHKGSAFGNIGMPQQPTQEMFENVLSCELLKLQKDDSAIFHPAGRRVWLEDESQRIGLVNIPNDLWNAMRKSPVYFLDIPFEERLKHITAEYGGLDRQRMIDAIIRIKERLGGLETKNAIAHLESNNTTESFRILLKYYDKWYLRGLHNREDLNSLLHLIKCESVTPENANRLTGLLRYHEKLSA
jgi:tRNA 2-selenouridine synthase